MLDLDTVATFMITLVTNYFARCGDSLEPILDENYDANAATVISPVKKQKEKSEPDQLTATSGDGMSICDSFDICHSFEADGEQEPFTIQEMDGTDLIFFPCPSSETPSTNRPLIGIRNPSSYDAMIKPVALGNRPLSRTTEKNDASKAVITPPSEIVSKWIEKGMSKENFDNAVPSHEQQQFPFDEMKIMEKAKSTSKKPPLGTLGTQQSRLKNTGSSRIDSPTTFNSNRSARIPLASKKGDKKARAETTKPSPTASSLQRYGNDSSCNIDNLKKSKENNHYRKLRNVMSSHWKEATDPRTGLTYYFHEITRETQWRKPMCLASDEERLAMKEKEQKERDFFAVMEANILNSLSRGVIPGTSAPDRRLSSSRQTSSASSKKEIVWEGSSSVECGESPRDMQKSSFVRPTEVNPNLIRTISGMEETLLKNVIRRQPSFRTLKPVGATREPSLDIQDLWESKDSIEAWANSSGTTQLSFRSSLGTLEEDSTGGNPEASPNSTPRSKSEKLSYLPETPTDDLSLKETEALTKLVSLTNEMIHAEKDDGDENAATQPCERTKNSDQDQDGHGESASQMFGQGTDGDIGHVLPRETDLEFSDEEEEEPAPLSTPRSEQGKTVVANSSKPTADPFRPGIQRRNTCGTMYIRTTMSAPDKDATIRCVCGVYRSHILSSEQENLGVDGREDFRVFNDYPDDVIEEEAFIPSLDDIVTFYRDTFFKAQMEADCIIMSLIYVERLIKKTIGRLRPRASNWRSLIFSCMILSSKVWDDLSMWNADFSESCPPGGVNFSLQRVNQLELAVLNSLKFNVKVLASEYAKYYFLLRSMLIKSGLGGEDLGSLDPLDVEGARRLQQVSSQFESRSIMKSDARATLNRRTKSLAGQLGPNTRTIQQPRTKVGLEQVVEMN